MNLESYFQQWAVPVWGDSLIPLIGILIVVAAIWSLVWKGMALWKAARLGAKGWFIAMLIINTLGILEILYIYVFSKKSDQSGQQ